RDGVAKVRKRVALALLREEPDAVVVVRRGVERVEAECGAVESFGARGVCARLRAGETEHVRRLHAHRREHDERDQESERVSATRERVRKTKRVELRRERHATPRAVVVEWRGV